MASNTCSSDKAVVDITLSAITSENLLALIWLPLSDKFSDINTDIPGVCITSYKSSAPELNSSVTNSSYDAYNKSANAVGMTSNLLLATCEKGLSYSLKFGLLSSNKMGFP